MLKKHKDEFKLKKMCDIEFDKQVEKHKKYKCSLLTSAEWCSFKIIFYEGKSDEQKSIKVR